MIISKITCLAIISITVVQAKPVAEFEAIEGLVHEDQSLFSSESNEQRRIIQKQSDGDYGIFDGNDDIHVDYTEPVDTVDHGQEPIHPIELPSQVEHEKIHVSQIHQIGQPSELKHEIEINEQHNDGHEDEHNEESGGLSGFVKKIGKSVTKTGSRTAEIMNTFINSGKSFFGKK